MLDENKDFDLLMRSMLEDAEARPPRGAWKAISSRLDGPVRTRQAVAGPWFRWAGATLAFAAALGLGLFFTGTNRSEPLQPERGIALLSGVKPEIITDFDNAAPLKSYAARLTASAETAPQVAETADDANVPAESIDNGSSPAAKPAGKSRKWKKMEQSQDDFDLLAMNESGSGPRARRLSLYTKGSIGGNDSDFKFKSPAVALAPGAKESGITELSTSTYGIPLTLGLGVRYYVLPRLSVGSGIDYSLLTRTFTGKYTGTSSVTGEEIQYDPNGEDNKRGLAGAVALYHIAAAAAREGKSLDEVAEIAQRYADSMASITVKSTDATHPQNGMSFGDLGETDLMEIGAGQHGEGGGVRVPMMSAKDTVATVAEALSKSLELKAGDKTFVMINGCGATTMMEMLVLFKDTVEFLKAKGVEVVASMVGEILTVQEAAGFQMNIAKWDEEFLRLWNTPCHTPAYSKE